ncbi:MAG TPA: copper transporter, partial [Acidimicrobiales bacterium]
SADDQLLTHDGYRYVFVTGPTPAIPDGEVLRPLLRYMSTDGPVPVVVASAAVGDDPEATRDNAIQPILNDAALKDAVSTVDDLESFPGLAASVLALKQLDNDVHGHYGVGDGVSALLPSGS